jgi:hypothetical protein
VHLIFPENCSEKFIMKKGAMICMNTQNSGLAVYQDEPQESFEICIASTLREKLAIFRLRYRIYAEEMSKNFPCMDHDNKLLYDALDESGILVYAKIGTKVIGTLRVNIGRVDDFPPFWVEVLDLPKFLEFDSQQLFAYSSKFMVLQDYRNSTVAYLLLNKAYELYCRHKITFSFGVSNFHLLRLYEQLGFRRYSRNFVDPGYGILAPHVMLVDDVAHLKAVHSSYYRIARKKEILGTPATQWFYENFPENPVILNSHLVSEEELWNYLCNRYGCPPNQAISVLRELSEAEAKKFLHCCGVVVNCQPGDQLTFRGDVCLELNVLIAGRLKAASPRSSAIMPGQFFGASGLVNHHKHLQNISAVTDAEILVLADSAFTKFRHSQPGIADKILQYLGRKKSITA